MNYRELSREDLLKALTEENRKYYGFKVRNLNLDMTRGKPCAEQLKLSAGILDEKLIGDGKSEENQECRNYGVLEGIPEARRLMGEMLGVPAEDVMVCGNSSLNLMYDTLMKLMVFGDGKGGQPWLFDSERKFICLVPGYDRHFLITEKLGFQLISIDLLEDGPDMDALKEAVKDPHVKGMWMVPKYSNPSGIVFSDDKIRELASMECGAPDFKIFCDDAYTVHYLKDEPARTLNILEACEESGNIDRAFLFGSTSKITFPGSGISAVCSSKNNMDYLRSHIQVQTIGYDKLNQLRHAHFFKDYDGIIAHMEKHAEILRPKFNIVLDILDQELQGSGLLEWTKPEGGYFVSVNTMDGCAAAVIAKARDCGVKFTPAGSTYPYKVDPRDRNIRIAPTLPPIQELFLAIEVLCCCVKICSIEKLLKEMN